MVLTDLSEREKLKVMSLEYNIESEGNFMAEPIVQLFCRDKDGNRRQIEVEGFYPSFYISEKSFIENEHNIFRESMIRSVTARTGLTSDANKNNAGLNEVLEAPRKTLHGQELVKINAVLPEHVSKLKESGYFDKTWEADVFFTNRFLVDSGIKQCFTLPRGEDRVQYEDIEAVDEGLDVPPRMVTIDIEVWAGDEFPDTQNPRKPITAVTVHDSYDDEYYAAVLNPDSVERGSDNTWDDSHEWEGEVEVYEQEGAMLDFINHWIIDKDPDLLTGWNSSRNEIGSGFDYPYWINRCERINEWSYRDLSPTDSCFVTNRGSPVIGGREMFDMLQAYKKTQIHEKRSYALGYIAEEELGYGKEDVADLDEGWLHEPVEFMKYNIRDVEAVVEIERSKNVLDMYDHIRSITGATYSEIADSNIGIIDLLFLRQAKDRNIALPTSARPDVQHYWGAYVFPPEAGKHKNVVYPDLSSLYPNLFRDMNTSPETIIGFENDLKESEYSKEDCYTVYVDTRDEQVKRDADEPERTTLYVLKPEVKESFVRETIQDLIDMKYEYKKDEYSSEAYGAVKRITNSVYGVMGDSVSYGKGFRLFDWRIAEAITLAGRDVIKHTASEFEERVQQSGYDDAKIIAGDTDSCVCEVPSADGMEETLEVSHKAAEYVDSTYDQFMLDRFNIHDNNMAVEIESYAASALFMNKKKRYAQWVRWDEGDEVDEIEVKGFELVRSDSAPITGRVQKRVIELILKNDEPKPLVSEYLRNEWRSVLDGEVDLEAIGKPSAINSDVWTYGYSEQDDGSFNYYTPQPHIRGARYATEYIDGEDIETGKPLMFYCSGIAASSSLPETYEYENKLKAEDSNPQMVEAGRVVDALAVEDVRNFPDGALVDWEKMANKTLRDPIEPIGQVMNWSWNDLTSEGTQTGLAAYM